MRTEVEERDGIKYVTHYIDRPIRQGDKQGESKGVTIDGRSMTTEIVRYIYNKEVEVNGNVYRG